MSSPLNSDQRNALLRIGSGAVRKAPSEHDASFRGPLGSADDADTCVQGPLAAQRSDDVVFMIMISPEVLDAAT